MLNILFDSIALAGGIESTSDWRIREAMHKAFKTDALALPPGDSVRLEKIAESSRQPEFFDSTSNRVLI